MFDFYGWVTVNSFQSSPTPKGGRYTVRLTMLPCGVCFNPRPPRKVGATTVTLPVSVSTLMFQSSPTTKGGRYVGVD